MPLQPFFAFTNSTAYQVSRRRAQGWPRRCLSTDLRLRLGYRGALRASSRLVVNGLTAKGLRYSMHLLKEILLLHNLR